MLKLVKTWKIQKNPCVSHQHGHGQMFALYFLLSLAIKKTLWVSNWLDFNVKCVTVCIQNRKGGESKRFNLRFFQQILFGKAVAMVTEEWGGDKYTVPGKELFKREAMRFEARGMDRYHQC